MPQSQELRIGLVSISDRASKGVYEDAGIPALKEWLAQIKVNEVMTRELVTTTPERAFELAGRYHDPHAAQRALDLAWTTTQIELRELDISPADAAAGSVVAQREAEAEPG